MHSSTSSRPCSGLRRARSSLAAHAVVAAALLVGAAGVATATTADSARQVRNLVAGSVRIQRLSHSVAAELAGAAGDNASLVYGIPGLCATATSCVYADKAATKTVVLFGDSHARMWLPSVLPILWRHHERLVLVGQSGCSAAWITFTQPALSGCNAVRSRAVATINAMKPSTVLISDRTSYPGFTSGQWRSALATTLAALAPSKARLVVIGDVQAFSVALPACVAAYPSTVQRCVQANPNTRMPGHEDAERAAAAAAHVSYVDPTRWLCTSTRCSPVIGPYVAYWNSTHVSVTYARFLAGVMGAALRPLL